MEFPIPVVVTILGLVCAALGWWMNDLWQAHRALRSDLSSFREHVAKEYITKDDFREDLREIKDTLRQIFDELKEKANRGEG